MSEFLTIGEPLVLFASTDTDRSLVDATHFQKFAAGAELNVSVGVSRLGHQTQYITRLGQDPLGDFIKKQLQTAGVGISYIDQTPEYWTGFQMKQRVSQGDPHTHYFRSGSAAAHFDSSQITKFDLSDVKFFHYTGIFPAISQQALLATQSLISRVQAKQGVKLTFDPNLRPSLWPSEEIMIETINKLAFQADVVLPGVHEAEQLTGLSDLSQMADFYFDHSQRTELVIIKLGAKGAFVKQRNGNVLKVKGYKVNHIVDTVGAGDGFTTGFITGSLDGLSLEEAVRRGNAIGALAIQSAGDNDGYPTIDELRQYQKSSA